MTFIEVVFKRILPISLIIIFCMYGISTIFMDYNVTFLKQEIYHSNVTNTDIIRYRWDLSGYATQLNEPKWENLLKPFKVFEVLPEQFSYYESYKWYDFVIDILALGIPTIVRGFKAILNCIALVFNITLTMPIQLIANLINMLMSLIGFDMHSSNWLTTTITWLSENFYIPIWY